jgi:hypothetical protein
MNLRIWLINLLFAGLALVVGLKAYDVWQSPNTIEVPTIKADSPQKEKVQAKKRRRMPPAKQYDVIVDNNLFSETRIEKIPEPPSSALPSKEVKTDGKELKHLVVYGIILTDSYRAALISRSPGTKGGRPNIWVQEGDMIEDLRVEKIYNDEVLFSFKGASHVLSVYDRAEVKRRSLVAKAQGPTVISTTAKKATPRRSVKKKPKRTTPAKGNVQTRKVTKERPKTREATQANSARNRARSPSRPSTGTTEGTSENLFQKLLQQRKP